MVVALDAIFRYDVLGLGEGCLPMRLTVMECILPSRQIFSVMAQAEQAADGTRPVTEVRQVVGWQVIDTCDNPTPHAGGYVARFPNVPFRGTGRSEGVLQRFSALILSGRYGASQHFDLMGQNRPWGPSVVK
jgi:hypothetical protein